MAKTDDEIERDFAALCAMFQWDLAERQKAPGARKRWTERGNRAAEAAMAAHRRIDLRQPAGKGEG